MEFGKVQPEVMSSHSIPLQKPIISLFGPIEVQFFHHGGSPKAQNAVFFFHFFFYGDLLQYQQIVELQLYNNVLGELYIGFCSLKKSNY